MSASIYDKLNSLCEEIEVDILSKNSNNTTREVLAELKDRAYLDRSPEAEFATQLYRKYREVAASSSAAGGSSVTHGGLVDNTIAGAAIYLSQPGRPFHYVNEITEGTSETLVGRSASTTHIFRLRMLVTVLQLISFIILAANEYVHQGYYLTTSYMLAKCPVTASAIEGHFDMRLFQCLCGFSFLVFFFNFCFAVYYVLPVDEESGRKMIPGFHSKIERALTAINSPTTTQHTRTFVETVSLACFINAKSIEMYTDAFLLFITSLFLIIGAIEVDRGAAFTREGTTSAVWYTLGTFFMTFKDCMEHPDPAANIRAAFAMMFLACSVSLLTVKYAYDSCQKHKARYMTADESGMESAIGKGSSHDGRSLIANQDEVDDVVQVDL